MFCRFLKQFQYGTGRPRIKSGKFLKIIFSFDEPDAILEPLEIK